ncbi:MAG: MarR family winged helix-turn-helix transcriptional regulator [Steroidobacteraceae bacterium]
MHARIAYTVGRLDRAVRHRLAEATSRSGLTVAQYTALSVLEARGPLSNAQLARRSFVTPQAMNEIIAAMVRKAMVARAPDASHGRIVRISLTRQGAQVLRRCDVAARRVEEDMLAGLPRARRAMLLEVLRGCVAALEEPLATGSPGTRLLRKR